MIPLASSRIPLASVADYRHRILPAGGRRSGGAFNLQPRRPYPLGYDPRHNWAEQFERFHFTKAVFRSLNRISSQMAAWVKRRSVWLTPGTGLHPFTLIIRTRAVNLRCCCCFPVSLHEQECSEGRNQARGKVSQGHGNV